VNAEHNFWFKRMGVEVELDLALAVLSIDRLNSAGIDPTATDTITADFARVAAGRKLSGNGLGVREADFWPIWFAWLDFRVARHSAKAGGVPESRTLRFFVDVDRSAADLRSKPGSTIR